MSVAIDHAGWAFKQGSKVKNWKKRYFVLRGRELSYFGSQNIYGRAEDEKGRVTVVGVEMVAGDAKSREELLLITCERKTQLLKIKPPTPEEARAWLRKLQMAVAPPNQSVGAFREREESVNATNLFGTDIHDEQDEGDATAYAYGQPPAPTESVQAYYKAAAEVTAPPPNPNAYTRPSVDKADSYGKAGRWLAESSLAMDTELESDDNQHDSDVDEQDAFYEASRGVPRGSLAQGNHIGVTQEGWVTVGEPHDQRSWKKRYGVLAGPTFTYFASKGGEAIETVWIKAVALSYARPNTLDLKLDSGRVLGLAANTREDLIEWERGVAAVLGTPVLLRATSSRDDAFASGDEYAAGDGGRRPSSYTGVFREGWLLIKQGFSKSDWKRRYFVLNGAMLMERETPTAKPLSESIVVQINVQNDSEIEVEVMSGRTLWLKAENTADTEAWIHALSDLVGTPSAVETKHLPTPVIRPLIQSVAPFQPSLQPPPPPPPMEKMGWLMKEGGLIKSWKRRYFVLEGDALHYFDKIDGVVLGGGIVMRVAHNNVTANSLDVHFRNGRILRISSATRADIDSWFEVLTRAAGLATRSTSSRESESSVAPPIGRDNSQEGWLSKRGQMLKTWKRRYFVIQRNRLMYYDTMNGDLLGSGTVFDVSVGDQRPYCLDVRFQNGRLLHVVASDDADFNKWHDALKTASNISETVMSQKSFSQEELPFERDFDYDMNDEGGIAGDADDLDFEDFGDLNDADDGSLGEWEAAMRNKPDISRQDSWDSSASEGNNDDASGYNSDGASSVSRGLRRQGSDASSVAEEHRGCSGWLRKEGGRIKTWKRRYFTLHGTTLKYFKSANGSLLRSLEVTQVEETPTAKFGLAITMAGGRRLVVAAESKEEYEKWLTTIWGVLADQRASLADNSGIRYSGVGVPSSPMAAGGAAAPAYPVKSGWLEKEGQRFKTWKKRYFTLKNGALMYFSDVGGESQGHGTIKGVIVDNTKPNTLRILMGKDRVMRVTAANAVDSSAWFQALTASIKSPHGSEAGDDDYSEVGSVVDRRSVGSAPSSPAASKDPTAQQTRASRFSADDYLKNDTITNESFLRIRGPGDELSLTNGSFYKPRSFKGDLFEAKLPTPQETEDGSSGLIRIDSDEDLEYLKGSNVENQKMDALRRKKEEEERLLMMPKGCAPCCIVM